MVVPLAYADIEFKDKIVPSGSGAIHLDNVTDVLSIDRHVTYIVDSGNDRISVFATTGDRLSHSSNKGGNCDNTRVGALCKGQFNNPISADNSDTNRFVLDAGNKRVVVFDDDWDFYTAFGTHQSRDSVYLGEPKGIAVYEGSSSSSPTIVFVSDSERNKIIAFKNNRANWNLDSKYGFDSTDLRDLRGPSSMVVGNDTLYIANSARNEIIILKIIDSGRCPDDTSAVKSNSNLCYVTSFGSGGSNNGQFNNPSGLEIDETNDLLYVSDTGNHRIQVFKLVDSTTCPSGMTESVDGVCFVETFGSEGTTNGKFKSPMGLALDERDRLYVADSGNNRVQILTVDPSTSAVPETTTTTTRTTTTITPKNIKAVPLSPTSILLTWDAPVLADSVPKITGYKIEYKSGSNRDYETIIEDTSSVSTLFVHKGLSNEEYTYRVYAVNSEGTSSAVTSKATPDHTNTPVGIAAPSGPNSIKLKWFLPSNIPQGIKVVGYEVFNVLSNGKTGSLVGETRGVDSTTYTVTGLTVNEEYSYKIVAKLSTGGFVESAKITATPKSDSKDITLEPVEATLVVKTAPSQPRDLKATSKGSTEIILNWRAPSDDGNSPITGYSIESKKGSSSFITLVPNTNSTSTTYSHKNIDEGTTYAYKVFAINAIGKSESASNEIAFATKKIVLELSPIQKITSNEEESISFTARLTDSSIGGHKFALSKAPKGASINENTGKFAWTPSNTAGGKVYSFDIVASQNGQRDTEQIVIDVKDNIDENAKPEPKLEPTKTTLEIKTEPKPKPIADFVTEDPQTYVDRYNNEKAFKEWFDKHYTQYESIYEAVGLPDPNKPVETPSAPTKPIADFVTEDPQTYVDRYNNEKAFKEWFDKHYTQYESIYQAVGLPDPNKPVETPSAPTKPIADFVTEDPQTYVDRYNNEKAFKEWFDKHYTQYESIYQAVGLPDPNKPVETPSAPTKPIADFVTEDPQTYVDRYNNEKAFKEWFDKHYTQYESIYQAVGLPDPNKPVETPSAPTKPIADFVTEDPQTYVDRYNNEKAFKEWFDKHYTQYESIYQAVGLPDPTEQEQACGAGTKLVDGVCALVEEPKPSKPWWQFW